ncbi:hypothetical protein MLD38_019863 [Melastoma candidum]|uniref:Uncharacterized protein n=1 Tax=Melastoma candidum TaxID=119954 RepID=A0ACB9QBJ9_9MYRT|nr:hypothetical protein MLD38_019863 [Melastoma candidum]
MFQIQERRDGDREFLLAYPLVLNLHRVSGFRGALEPCEELGRVACSLYILSIRRVDLRQNIRLCFC